MYVTTHIWCPFKRTTKPWNAEEETGTECLPTVESLAADEVEAADEADADSFALMD